MSPRFGGVAYCRLLEGAVTLLVLLLPFTLPFTMSRSDTAPRVDSLTYFPVDVGLLLLSILGMPLLLAVMASRRLPLPCGLLLLLTALTALAAAAHPTPAAWQLVLRTGAVAIVVLVLSELRARLLRGPVLWALVVVGLEQAALAIGQAASGELLGLTALGEVPNTSLIRFGGVPSAKGTFFHVYTLAAFAAVVATIVLAGAMQPGRCRLLWCVTAGVSVPLGLTYSRMSVLVAVALIVVVTAGPPRWYPQHVIALAALLIGMLVPALVTADGWLSRGQQSVAAADERDLDGLASGRVTFVQQALRLIEDQPVVGVGPANYEAALGRAEPELELIYHVHNVPLLVAAESGVAAGVVMTGVLVSLGFAAARGGPATRVVYVALFPFLMLDVLTAVTAQGLVIFGIWAGAVLAVAGRSSDGIFKVDLDREVPAK